MFKNRHVGWFDLSLKLINDEPELVKIVLQEMLIIEAKYNPIKMCVQYLAINENLFALVAEGCEAPVYTIMVEKTKNPDKSWSYKVTANQ
jgi:hypothetical protein